MSGKKRSWKQRAKNLLGWSEPEKSDEEYERTMHKLGLDVLKDQKLEHRQAMLLKFEEQMNEEIVTHSLIEYVQELKDRQDLLHHALMEISAPFARSGDIDRFGRMFHGWNRLNASASSWILRAFDIVKKTEKHNGKKTQEEPTDKPEPKDTKKPETKDAKKDEPKPEEKVQGSEKKLDNIMDDAEELLDEIESESIDPRFLVQCLHDVLQKHIWKDGFLILEMCFLDRDISPRSATVIQNVNAQRERESMTQKPDFG